MIEKKTIQAIRITKNNLAYLGKDLKKIIEEGVNKAFDLDEIVNSQKIVKSIIEKSQSEIKYVKICKRAYSNRRYEWRGDKSAKSEVRRGK